MSAFSNPAIPFSAFLKIDGITTGDLNGLELESFSWGVSNSGTPSTGEGDIGRATFSDFTFASAIGQQSPQLFQKCVSGEHISAAVLTVGGSRGVADIIIKMNDVIVSNYQFTKHDLQKIQDQITGKIEAGEIPTESVSLNFSKMEFSVGGTSGTGGTSGKI